MEKVSVKGRRKGMINVKYKKKKRRESGKERIVKSNKKYKSECGKEKIVKSNNKYCRKKVRVEVERK